MLNYNVYTDAQRTIIWGDGTAGTQVFTENAQPNNHPVTVPVYGRIFGAAAEESKVTQPAQTSLF